MFNNALSVRFCAVPAVHVPTRVPVPPQGAGAEPQHGHHRGRLPVLDVEGPQFPAALPLHWLLLGTLPSIHTL